MKNRKSVASRSPDTPSQPAASSKPSLGADIRGKIGQQLRQMYDEDVAKGVPERFVELLNRLERQNEK